MIEYIKYSDFNILIVWNYYRYDQVEIWGEDGGGWR
jgi:hypothetical protein